MFIAFIVYYLGTTSEACLQIRPSIRHYRKWNLNPDNADNSGIKEQSNRIGPKPNPKTKGSYGFNREHISDTHRPSKLVSLPSISVAPSQVQHRFLTQDY
jgi:hypothetical protein